MTLNWTSYIRKGESCEQTAAPKSFSLAGSILASWKKETQWMQKTMWHLTYFISTLVLFLVLPVFNQRTQISVLNVEACKCLQGVLIISSPVSWRAISFVAPDEPPWSYCGTSGENGHLSMESVAWLPSFAWPQKVLITSSTAWSQGLVL